LRIQVVYKNGKEDQINQKTLDLLLQLGEIQEFRRADHWVNATSDPIRSDRHTEYNGSNRRTEDTDNLAFSA